MQWIYGFNLNNLRGDLLGGLTAAVVALPLALAFGVSSGAGAIAGVYGAICVGFFAALFGGTPSQVSGPTGPMTVVMAATFTQYSSIDPEQGPVLAFTVVILAGVMQIVLGLFRLGKYITLVPFPVISGFMTGIGVIIILLQLAPFLGHSAQASVLEAIRVLPADLRQLNVWAAGLGLLTLLIVFFCPRKVTQVLPSALIALIAGTLLAILLVPQDAVAVLGEIPTGLPSMVWPQISSALLGDMLLSALMLAILGAVDSLLTSLVADNITKTHHSSDRELIGQGVGNMVAGLFGGLPGAGATMRTVVNVRAGGKTPISGGFHALILLLIVLGAGPLAEHIPHAVLAGILLKVGIDIIDWKFLSRLHRAPLFVICLLLLVLCLTVFVNLIAAVFIGVFLANIVTLKRLADSQIDAMSIIADQPEILPDLNPAEQTLLREAGGKMLLFHFEGPVSFASAKGMSKKLGVKQPHDVVIMDFVRVPWIDVSTAMVIEDLIVDARQAGREVLLVGLNEAVLNVFERLRILACIPPEHLLAERQAALEYAAALVSSQPS
ncbi:SulP family inorganic anion transporter [Pontibacter sp. JAM-7]|uniref:SulP family inorganic anion transporter n=1 Tax=Pontibacter sp. JAM-7 TaxID=3366581 RepID=UPI003AF9269A